jgi:hypothetical protein
MINLKACTGGGDLMIEEVLDETELVCLQCGHRTFAPSQFDDRPAAQAAPPARGSGRIVQAPSSLGGILE